jgi:MYXO-CTERM domain-containing protein
VTLRKGAPQPIPPAAGSDGGDDSTDVIGGCSAGGGAGGGGAGLGLALGLLGLAFARRRR